MRVNSRPTKFFLALFFFFALTSRMFSQSQDAEILMNHRTVEVFPDGTMTTITFRKILIHTENGKKRFTQLVMGYNPDLDELNVLNVFKLNAKGGKTEYETKSIPVKENITGIASRQLVISLPQADIGETVGYEIQSHRKKPLFKKHFWNILNVQEDVPVKRSVFEVKIPAGFTLYYQALSGGAAAADSRTKIKPAKAFWNPSITKTKTHTTYVWTLPEMPDLPSEKLYTNGARILLGSTKDWKEIAAWFSDAYKSASAPTEKIKNKVKELTQTTSTKDEALQKVFRYASQYISYFAEELGLGALLPRNADDILKDRRGDCKDKTALLLAFLKTLNITAYPVLVNTDAGLDYEKLLPTPYYFNHVLLALPDGKGNYSFLDPTLTDAPFVIDSRLHAQSACILKNSTCTFWQVP